MKFKYLKHISLPYYDGDVFWTICPITGSLLRTNIHKNEPQKIVIPLKVSRAIEYCNQPYLCYPNNEINPTSAEQNSTIKINKMHERILNIGNGRFYLTRLYSSLKHELFNTTNEAIFHINSIEIQIELKHQLCLQRAFLASKISKSFGANGVIFIGAFLPTGDMHAWIIENGTQPDSDDRGWVNYRPLLAFYN